MNDDKNLLEDPKLSRVIWHEAKKYPSIFRLYLTNIQSEIYGPVPEDLKEPINDLALCTSDNLIFIEAISMLSKVELKNLSINKETFDTEAALSSAVKILSPLTAQTRAKLKHSSAKITYDLILLEFILKTVLYICLKICKDSPLIEIIVSGENKLSVLVKISNEKMINVPADVLESSLALDVNDRNWQPVAVHLATLVKLVKLLGGSFSIAREGDKNVTINISNI